MGGSGCPDDGPIGSLFVQGSRFLFGLASSGESALLHQGYYARGSGHKQAD